MFSPKITPPLYFLCIGCLVSVLHPIFIAIICAEALLCTIYPIVITTMCAITPTLYRDILNLTPLVTTIHIAIQRTITLIPHFLVPQIHVAPSPPWLHCHHYSHFHLIGHNLNNMINLAKVPQINDVQSTRSRHCNHHPNCRPLGKHHKAHTLCPQYGVQPIHGVPPAPNYYSKNNPDTC